MRLENRVSPYLRIGRGLVSLTALLSLVLMACQAQQTAIRTEINSSELNPTSTPNPPRTLTPLSPATTTVLLTSTLPAAMPLTPTPTLLGPQIVINGGFDNGIRGWEQPYGTFQHTTSEFHTGPGAARLTTSSETGFLEYRASVGQCIDLTNFLEAWPEFEGLLYMRLEAYLHPGGQITNVSLNGIFLDDHQCGTGQVGFFEIPSLESDQPWTRLAGTRSIPAEARSFHIFINASGFAESAVVFIDDLRAYPSEPPQVQVK